jgi:TolB-like protein
MMRIRLTIAAATAVWLASLVLPPAIAAQGDTMADSVGITDNRPSVAVLPFANYTGEAGANTIVPLMEQELWRDNFYVVRSPRVRRTLRQYRIRTAGMIDSANAQLIADRWEVDYLLVGSLDIYKEDVVPEAAFSVRLVEARSMKIVWAKSVAATGADFTGLFGLGRITNMPALLRALVKEAVRGADKTVRQYEAGGSNGDEGRRIAVVIFDNQSSNRRGGEIVSSILVNRLWKKGVSVVEPGDVITVFRRRNLQARGEVMREVLNALKKEQHVDYVLTGSVDEFQPGRASVSRSFPIVSISARLVDAQSGLVAASRECYRSGADSEFLLGLGGKRALGDLTAGMLDDLIDRLLSDVRKNYATRR